MIPNFPCFSKMPRQLGKGDKVDRSALLNIKVYFEVIIIEQHGFGRVSRVWVEELTIPETHT